MIYLSGQKYMTQHDVSLFAFINDPLHRRTFTKMLLMVGLDHSSSILSLKQLDAFFIPKACSGWESGMFVNVGF